MQKRFEISIEELQQIGDIDLSVDPLLYRSRKNIVSSQEYIDFIDTCVKDNKKVSRKLRNVKPIEPKDNLLLY